MNEEDFKKFLEWVSDLLPSEIYLSGNPYLFDYKRYLLEKFEEYKNKHK